MKKFAEIITDEQILQSVAAKLSWTHNITLIIKIKEQNVYKWYGEQTIDDILKHPQDNPTIGIMLCKTRDKLTPKISIDDDWQKFVFEKQKEELQHPCTNTGIAPK